jgi:H+-translocating NAD(P) transhydrogenase subunit beta
MKMEYLSLIQSSLEENLFVLMMSVFAGYFLVLRVSLSLHAPLMALTNAISSIIVLGHVLFVIDAQDFFIRPLLTGSALFFLGINILGGLSITHRMLSFFRAESPWKNWKLWGVIILLMILGSHSPTLACLGACVLFLISFDCLSSLKRSQESLLWACAGFTLCLSLFPFSIGVWGPLVCGGLMGLFISKRINMTALPQLMAAFHSLVGVAAVFLGILIARWKILFVPDVELGTGPALELASGVMIGAVTFTGSILAFLKLQELKLPSYKVTLTMLLGNMMLVLFACIGFIGLPFLQTSLSLSLIAVFSGFLGVLMVWPIGGADMPVVVSLLNSYSGFATVALGFSLQSPLFIVIGSIVGSSGMMLSQVMCKGMNRSLINVLFGGFANTPASLSPAADFGPVKPASPEDAAFLMSQVSSVVIIPGYGMAVAQAQYALREMADVLVKKGVRVRYAIHPVAGRMPGHMNVLLAEAQVPYENICEFEEINADFANTDVVFVIGANDVTNPLAKDPNSSIYGMPVFDILKAKQVLFLKRSMSAGYAGVDNPVFYDAKTLMVFGDAKKSCEAIVKELQH